MSGAPQKQSVIELVATVPPDRDGMVVEVYLENRQVAEVFHDGEVPMVQFYSTPNQPLQLPLTTVNAMLERAADRLHRYEPRPQACLPQPERSSS